MKKIPDNMEAVLQALGAPRPELREEWRTASHCYKCRKPLPDLVIRYDVTEWPYGSTVEAFCADCMHTWAGFPADVSSWPRWVRGCKIGRGVCEECGRQVVTTDSRRRKFTYCSERCRDEINRRAHLRPEPDPRPCDQCGELFTPARADARYCSPACRQKAYRARKA